MISSFCNYINNDLKPNISLLWKNDVHECPIARMKEKKNVSKEGNGKPLQDYEKNK